MFDKYIELIKEELHRKGIKAKDIRITSFDLPHYLNYCYLGKNGRTQGTYVVENDK